MLIKFKTFLEKYNFQILELDTDDFIITISESVNSYELEFSDNARKFIEDICYFILGEDERDYLSFINNNNNSIDDYEFIDKNKLFHSYIIKHAFIKTDNIIPNKNSLICMPLLENTFVIQPNSFLNKKISAYFNTHFYGYGKQNNPDYLNVLKNDNHQNWSDSQLKNAANQLKDVLLTDLPLIADIERKRLTVCVVPRSKTDISYRADQLLFKSTVKEVLNQLNDIDGIDYIERHTNTKTTHLRRQMEGFTNDGLDPYVGISKETCHFSPNIQGADILLIDDIYTKTVNIDEDMIQALLDNRANSVIFYAIGNTISKF